MDSKTPKTPAEICTSFAQLVDVFQQDWLSAICIENERQLPDEIPLNTTCIIAPCSNELPQKIISTLNVPDHLPILLVCLQGQTPQPTGTFPLIVDHLFLPAAIETLLCKKETLTRINTLAREHQNYQRGYSKELDIIYNFDSLTGLRNRRKFTADIIKAFATAKAAGSDLSLLFFNIDLLSEINENYGLDFGDHLLNQLAARATTIFSSAKNDSRPRCYRYSSEDFAFVLPGFSEQQSKIIGQKLQKRCSQKQFQYNDTTLKVTLSVGIANLRADTPESYEQLIFMAETALFRAKALGRNQIQFHSQYRKENSTAAENPVNLLKEKLERILVKTKTSAISSLQYIAKTSAGSEHDKHTQRLMYFTDILCQRMNLPTAAIKTFHNSINLYTSFRFMLYKEILKAPKLLNKRDRDVIKTLPYKIQELTEVFDYFAMERELLVSQTENYDGSGYPYALRGSEIPVGARILKLTDALAAMTGERAYREKLEGKEIIDELCNGAGIQFDPTMTLLILELIEKYQLVDVSPRYLAEKMDTLKTNLPNLIIA